MRISLRVLVMAVFALLVISSVLQGVLSIATTARSAQQLTALEQRGLVPTVGLGILSQNLDQERALITANLSAMTPIQVQAVEAELGSLDQSIAGAAARLLPAQTGTRWAAAWQDYQTARRRYLNAVLGHRRPAIVASLRLHLSDRLDAVLDIVQGEEGAQLFRSENLYSSALAADWDAIKLAVICLCAALVVGAALATTIVLRLHRGLENLVRVARLISRGRFKVRARVSGCDEITDLASAFNHMTDALLSAERRAETDALTGLLNHRAFHGALSAEMARARESGEHLSVLLIDLHDFTYFNHAHGHEAGDQVLVTIADLLQRECRSFDRVARFGGDEFAVLAVQANATLGNALAERIRRACAGLSIKVRADSIPVPVTLSIGVASFPHEAETSATLIDLAGHRLRERKRTGDIHGPGLPDTAIGQALGTPYTVLDGLVTAIDNKDLYTREHSEWVARFADVLAGALGLDAEARRRLRLAALIHDVGKIGIPDRILRKPDRLSDEEYAVMKQHVRLSELLVSQVAPSPDILNAVRYHHERWDGGGYPHGLKGGDIPLEGRIMIIADAASAMYLDRPYRKGLAMGELVAELRRHRGTQFDPELSDLFVSALTSSSSPAGFSATRDYPSSPAAR